MLLWMLIKKNVIFHRSHVSTKYIPIGRSGLCTLSWNKIKKSQNNLTYKRERDNARVLFITITMWRCSLLWLAQSAMATRNNRTKKNSSKLERYPQYSNIYHNNTLNTTNNDVNRSANASHICSDIIVVRII